MKAWVSLFLLLAMAGAVAPIAAKAAVYYCSEPVEPYCLSQYGTFHDEWSFKSCKAEVNLFTEQVKEYLNCLEMERQAAVQKAQETIDRFNCKAKGGTFCP